MFTASINGRAVRVTFSRQISTKSAPLTRPMLHSPRREPVHAVTYCNFDNAAVGVAWCSMSDAGRYSKEKGRKVSLAMAIQQTLYRRGKLGRDERRQVWLAYFAAKSRSRFDNRFNQIMGEQSKRQTTMAPVSKIVPQSYWEISDPEWPVSPSMPDDVIAHLNQEDQNTDTDTK